jgi:hypothetical protein
LPFNKYTIYQALKVPVVILLALAIFTQSMSRGIILLSYYTNKQAYERYCINKSRPQMHCDGKCQLGKKLKAEEEQDKKDPLKNASFSEIVMICQANDFHIAPSFHTLFKEKIPHPLSIGKPIGWSASCFHPPSVV